MMNNSGGNSGALAAHYWAGEAGARWLGQLDRFESMIEPIGEALLARAAYAAGERVVDIGCGGGVAGGGTGRRSFRLAGGHPGAAEGAAWHGRADRAGGCAGGNTAPLLHSTAR